MLTGNNFISYPSLTVNSKSGLCRISRSKVVGDDTLVFPLTGKLHTAKLQGGRILRHLRLASYASLNAQVGLVVDLRIVQDLIVFLPGEGHGRVAGAGRRTHERHIGALKSRLGLWLHSDLRFREVVYAQKNREHFRFCYNSLLYFIISHYIQV